ncbi:MAG TPA: ABC transporter permease [Ilumatobacter sp.]
MTGRTARSPRRRILRSPRRRVALARKNLFQDRRRAVLAVTGVGVSLVLVLVLDGIFAGAMQQVNAYMRSSPADVFVAQKDVRTMHMTQSALPPETVDAVRAVDGVAWAEGLRYTTSIVESDDGRQLTTYVLGYDTATGRGGPRRLAAGESPGPGEVLVDDVAAEELGVDIGDTVTVLGAPSPLRVSGMSTGGTNIVNTTVYVRSEDFARLRGNTFAYVLVGAEPGVAADALAQRLADALPDTTVQTRAEFARQEANVVRDMAADVMKIVTVIGFLIALAVTGLTLFTATLAKLREYGIVKALGAGPGRLAVTVAAQAAWSVALGLAVAVAVSIALGAAIGAATPNVQVAIETGSVIRTGAGALLIGALASLVPLRRVLRVDPATAFRRP